MSETELIFSTAFGARGNDHQIVVLNKVLVYCATVPRTRQAGDLTACARLTGALERALGVRAHYVSFNKARLPKKASVFAALSTAAVSYVEASKGGRPVTENALDAVAGIKQLGGND